MVEEEELEEDAYADTAARVRVQSARDSSSMYREDAAEAGATIEDDAGSSSGRDDLDPRLQFAAPVEPAQRKRAPVPKTRHGVSKLKSASGTAARPRPASARPVPRVPKAAARAAPQQSKSVEIRRRPKSAPSQPRRPVRGWADPWSP